MTRASPPVAVSVVIPTHGRPQELACCLRALAAQVAPVGGFEVVVVIDGAEDAAASVAVARASGVPTLVVVQPRAGPAAARNHGARLASGRWLAFTDDDCRPMPGWLVALATEVEREPHAVVGGSVRNALRDNPSAVASQLVQDVAWTHFSRRDDPARYVPSNNIALARDAFERIGGFDADGFPRTAEDRDLCDRALAAGLELRRAPDAVVDHHHDLSPLRLWRQHRAYGRGALAFQRSRARRGLPALKVELRFFGVLAVAPFSRASGVRTLWLAALVATTQVAYVTGYAAERWMRGTPL